MNESLLIDWIGREGGALLAWWLLTLLAGLIVWPLAFRLLGGLTDRGYPLVKALGLLLIGFVYWLGGSLGLLVNAPGSILLAALLVLAAGLVLLWPHRQDMLDWVSNNWKYMLFVELLFVALFVGWAVVRAHNPDTFTTEKGMDIAFLSAIVRSETFPPNDPWMSGYAISYYYFGYLIAGGLTLLSGVSSGAGFSLMIALLFALSGLGAFGVVYNMVRIRASSHRRKRRGEITSRSVAVAFGLLAVIFVTLLGNFYTPIVELPYQSGAASAGYLSFWDIAERDTPRLAEGGADLNSWSYWWWFRASRIIRDRDLTGAAIGAQPIDEFPAFSFILADMHPHVLALPFVLLAIALALNVALSEHAPTRPQIALYGVALGGLIFLNTWDAPIYLGLLLGAEAVRRLLVNEDGALTGQDWRALLTLGASLLGLMVILYAPFLLGFRSQLGGVLPNVIFTTRIQQFFVMFGPFLLILAVFLAVEWWRGLEGMNWGVAVRVVLAALAVLVALLIVLGIAAWLSPGVRGVVYQVLDTAGGLAALSGAIAWARLAGLPVLLLTGGMAFLVLARLFSRPLIAEDEPAFPPSTGFALLLVGLGAVLALLPDFLYLRDNFAVRMNTIFKFYYQVWIVWAIASAYAAYTLIADVDWSLRPAFPVRVGTGVLLAVVLITGLLYPALAVYTRAWVEPGRVDGNGGPLTLDGGYTTAAAGEYETIRCLGELVEGDDAVIAEAVGSPYRPHEGGRVAALTGIPTVINWEGHERQWRGATYDAAAGTRVDDINRLYNDPNWAAVTDIVERYGIDYIFVGAAEQRTVDPFGLQKFIDQLTPVCEFGGYAVYQVVDVD